MGNIFEDILDSLGGKGGSKVEVPNVPLPVLREINPELYKQIITLNPELEKSETLEPSAMAGISLDPRLRQVQLNALNKLQDISNNNGRDAQFQADASRLQNDVNSNLKGNSEAVQQNMAARGMSSGMSEMVNKQLNTQQGANRQAQMEMDLNAQAQQRALSALMSGANLGSQMSQQDFNQQAAKAQAVDAINKFNTSNKQQVQNNNVNTQNQAQQWNAQNTQGIANQNVQQANEAKYYNNNLPQQQFNNQMSKTGMQTQADLEEQRRRDARRQGNLQFAGGVIGAGMSAAGSGKGGA